MSAALVPAQRHRVRLAAAWLRAGAVVGYPTEAVYGLGCDPRDRGAVSRILEIKQRDPAKGLILIAADYAQLAPYVESLEATRMAKVRASWPGPNTWLLPARPSTPDWLTGRFSTLAVRVTAHPLAAALCRAYGGAIVSTSANRADRPPARTARSLRLALAGDGPDHLLHGACGGADRPSVIRDAASGRVLRG
ncbi:tRNA threonylcarbamoyladenosine biosynthesis protein RimN [Marichromatium purpuratum 984]|uniref:Threonylcarbamoyl-AMP synthase n=1 Tax=Marichromatium purpuratum 984 TaxID=765910 RepID=W0E105_MARPU|nr:Sua5/YciO/YrdC/YwlC family protein [Marichromatium purpuratum]AHF03178.1 tRNA threonylcarbamoyladenosine biosynthesis protein RimN [Marichromatium purpuratum 984]